MRINLNLVSLIFLLTVVPLEAQVNFSGDLMTFFLKAALNFMFPKDPDVVRVRKLDEIQTLKNVTTLDFIGLVERYNGYSAEEHYVTTEDGYNLVIHRITKSTLSKSRQKRKVVFLQHAFLCSSDAWVLIGPGKDLAFLLADHGYDVWLGNCRGNSYCRSHIKLSPRNKQFWQFSYHEVGTKDLPAMIDYVLSNTKQKTLRYIGHSMGTTALFTLLSLRPEYNSKIKLGILLGPAAIWKQVSPLLKQLVNYMPMIKEFLDYSEIYEIGSLSSTLVSMGRTLCADKTISQALCATVMFLIVGFDPAQLNTTALPEILSHIPAGGSTQTLLHFFQNAVTKKFQSYDYGPSCNYKQYGQMTPLEYNLKKVTAPLALFYGANDLLSLKSNVLETYRHLPNVILLEEVPLKLFNHLDFVWAIDAKNLLYDRVIELIHEIDEQAETPY